VLDVVENTEATIISDLSHVPAVPDETFDCIILTHVLGIIPEYTSALEECYRMLKHGGTILITSSCLSPVQDHSPSLWRFTPKGLHYAVSKYFGDTNTNVVSYGNVLTGQCFWVGMSQEELTTEELMFQDKEYPCVVACRATKV
jgi:ubiquinone/menaquinone biosynthesis C-methylase UbiE